MARRRSLEPTEKQLDVLRYIVRCVEMFGYQPAQSEIAAEFGITKNAVTERLKGLEGHGVIGLPEGNRERAIRLKHVRFRAEFTKDAWSGEQERPSRRRRS
jgi:DNA-binding MarR family transcriptional regulator